MATVPAPNSGWTQVSAHTIDTCGLKSDGTLACWGANTYGGLNIIAPNANWTQVSTNYHNTCAMKNDGAVYCWGLNTELQSPIITLSPTTLPDGRNTVTYTAQTFTAAGSSSVDPYTFSVISGALSTGLALDPASGVLSGLPSAAGSFPLTIQAMDANHVAGNVSLTLLIAPSSMAGLNSLALSSGTLTPPYAPNITSYTAAVPYATASLSVTAAVAQADSSLTVNGAPVTSGSPSGAIPLAVGQTTITVVVTAQDGVTTRTFTVSVTRAPSSNANLSGLALSSGNLTPAFASGVTTYTASVVYSVTGLTVTPTASDAAAVVRVNGTPVTSGSPSAAISLAAGENVITVLVTAPDGATTQTYTVTVTRTSARATITQLSSSANPASSGAPILLTAVVSGMDLPTGTVTFKERGAVVPGCSAQAVDGSAHAACPLAALSAGVHIFTAEYSGDASHDASTATALYQAISRLPGVGVGNTHSCVLQAGGALTCWGDNTFGQITIPSLKAGWVQISAGYDHACAVKGDGTLACWGSDSAGQSTVPAPNAGWTQVSAGRLHSCGLKEDTTLTCWGSSAEGQSTVPAPNTGWVQVSAHTVDTCGLRADGSLVCWGSNAYGGITLPTLNSGWVQVSTGNTHTCVVRSDGAVYYQGANTAGETPVVTLSPASLPGGMHGVGYAEQTFTASGAGSSAPYTFSVIAGSLPSGLALDPVSGKLTGIPLSSGSFELTVQAVDAHHVAGSVALTLDIAPSNNASLGGLLVSSGNLSPGFSAAITGYTLAVPFGVASLTVTPTAGQADATFTVNGVPVTSGGTSAAIALAVGDNTLTIVVTAEDGATLRTYTVTRCDPPYQVWLPHIGHSQ
jgi:trimeric autotransporter adhesin